LHVPVTKTREEKIDPVILGGLSFADEKILEITTLTKGIKEGKDAVQTAVKEVADALEQLKNKYRSNDTVRQEVAGLTREAADRDTNFVERLRLQEERFKLPLLPTTTIGSLPQTSEVRSTRAKWRRGEITNEAYEAFVNDNIKRWI